MTPAPETTPAHILAFQILVQARIPVFLWGGTGRGKTSAVEALRQLDEPVWTLILSLREPTDMGGLPRLNNDDNCYDLVAHRYFRELVQAGRGRVFFDEFNLGNPDVMKGALRVVRDGWAGDLQLPSETSWIAAGNKPSPGSDAFYLSAPSANRWAHLDWPFHLSTWRTGMLSGWPRPELVHLPPDWKERIPAKRALVVAFSERRPGLIDPGEPETPELRSGAFPTPRSWDMAAFCLAAAEAAGFDAKHEVARLLVRGCVGDDVGTGDSAGRETLGAATEFFSYVVHLDLRNPEEYLTNPRTPLPKRQDQIAATLSAVASAALDRNRDIKTRIKRFRAGCDMLAHVARECGGDIAMPAARIFMSALRETDLQSIRDDLPDALLELEPIMRTAGIVK